MVDREPTDYVKKILTTIEYENKQYWARKLWPKKYTWIVDNIRNLHKDNEPNIQELRILLAQINQPTFEQHLARIWLPQLCNSDSEINYGHDASTSPSNQKTPKNWPKLSATSNQEYGRFGRRPIEEGGTASRRIPYTKLRQIGSWNDKFDKIFNK